MPKCYISSLRIAASVESYIIKEGFLLDDETNNIRLLQKINQNFADNENATKIEITLGVGRFRFKYREQIYEIIREVHGTPLPCNNHFDKDSIFHEEVYVNYENQQQKKILLELVETAIKETKRDGYIQTHIWDSRRNYWEQSCLVPERDFKSVVLKNKIKTEMIKDIEEFTSEDTHQWYKTHGIPYKRGYLLYGIPGSGKSSTIRAISSKLRRDIYTIDLADIELSDSSLLSAVNSVEKSSVIYFEDIDTIFDKNRNKLENCGITFSGLLNALDGICVSRGQIFIITSNEISKLDKSLIRCGRIDLKFKFDYCTKEQAKEMFLRFYPDCFTDSEIFSKSISEKTSCADLQNHFIKHRKVSSNEANRYCDESYVFDEISTIYS